MEQHPIPRQITTFEYKLIGPMTIRQFGYVVLGGIFGYAAFLIMPIFILNYIAAIVVFCVGLAFAFIPINERPLDVFVKNFARRLNSATQYTFHKNNPPLSIMSDLYFESNPHITIAHADSKEKLSAYLAQKKAPVPSEDTGAHPRTGTIASLLSGKTKPKDHAPVVVVAAPTVPSVHTTAQTDQPAASGEHSVTQDTTHHTATAPSATPSTKHPFLSGTAHNRKNIPLPGVLLYLKEPAGERTLRILKTNPHGVFATFKPLPAGTYVLDITDPSGNYQFDRQTIELSSADNHIIDVASKELM